MPVPHSDSTPKLDALLSHSAWVRQLARAIVKNHDVADEVEQEAWRIALERPPQNTSNLKAWWTRVVHTTVSQRFRTENRHQKRVDRFSQQAATAETSAPADIAARMEDSEWLARVVNELPPLLGEAIFLRYFEEQSVAVIAEQLGIAQSAVKSRLRRGLEQLQSRFETHHGENWRARCLALAAPPSAAVAPASLLTVLLMSTFFKSAAAITSIALLAYIAFWPDPVDETLSTSLQNLSNVELERGSADLNGTGTSGRTEVGSTTADPPIAEPETPPLPTDVPRDAWFQLSVVNDDGTAFANQELRVQCKPEYSLEQQIFTTDGNGLIQVPCISKPWKFVITSVNPSSANCILLCDDVRVNTEQMAEFNLRHPGEVPLNVRVIDNQDQPVAGIQVQYSGVATSQRGWAYENEFMTDQNGNFALTGIRGDYTLQVTSANNFRVLKHDLLSKDTRTQRRVIRLPETRMVDLTVLGVNNEPVTASDVVASAFFEFDQHAPFQRDAKKVDLGALDANGQISLEAPANRDWPLFLKSKDYGELLLNIPAGVTEYVHKIDQGHSLTGRVVDHENRPLLHAKVSVWVLHYSNDWATDNLYRFPSDRRDTHTNADGKFSVDRIQQSNEAFVLAQADGMAYSGFKEIQVPNGSDEMLIQLQPEAIISGTLVDAMGDPVVNRRISANGNDVFNNQAPWRNIPHMAGGGTATTDQQGKFIFNGLTPELWKIEVQTLSRSEPAAEVTVPGGITDLVIRMGAGLDNKLNVEALVVDAASMEYLSNVEASLQCREKKVNGVNVSGYGITTRTSKPQIVKLGLGVDDYVLEVKSPGYATTYTQIPAQSGFHNLVVTMNPAKKIELQFSRPEGKNLYWTAVKVFHSDGTLIPNSKRFSDEILNGKPHNGQNASAYGLVKLLVPIEGGYLEVTPGKGLAPVRIEIRPEWLEAFDLIPIELSQ
ncbi:MAG: sigma-70 family RNA polymerase sigma factor [Planctomycetes bacterium]|nr:sigma-70 family RNA polymerase sigma factor [Planctomycetota bacterium]